MPSIVESTATSNPNGVMFNAYPDSIGRNLADLLQVLKRPEFRDVFSLFYVLPTFFNSDLDRGFSVIDYNLNEELVTREDLVQAYELGLNFKFDLVLNHMSVGSHQFQDMLANGDRSPYRDFFIDWNAFWRGEGEMGPEGYVLPRLEHLDKLFMRKPELPILMVRFPDGSEHPYWNTFYQEINYREISAADLEDIDGMTTEQASSAAKDINAAIQAGEEPACTDLGDASGFREKVMAVVESRRQYLGQMDLNAKSEVVWAFFDETLKKLHDYGARLVRLDAFAYLHKEVGQSNFFNKPGTWEYLGRLKSLAEKYGITLLPEIHAQYGSKLHEEVAAEGYPIYDFFLPGLLIDALDRGENNALLYWIGEVLEKGIRTVNMLGCHDGIPVLDLRGKDLEGQWSEGLLSDAEIDVVVQNILDRGGRIKNLYAANGKRIAYYQVNATYFSALGEDDQKLLLARAIQLFAPGIPQVWYLDLFAGKNDHEAADRGGTGGHKEINRTTLSLHDIEAGMAKRVVLDQLDLIRLRNTHPAFHGSLQVGETEPYQLRLTWRLYACMATLEADLRDHSFTISHSNGGGTAHQMRYPRKEN